MAIHPLNRARTAIWLARHDRALLAAIVVLAVVARLVALFVLHEPVESDAASYLEMARTVIAPGPMRDIYGNAAFYSPGYPFALAAWFMAFGIGLGAVQALNLALGVVATVLVHRLARQVSGDAVVALLAAAGFAVLIPAVAGTALIQRENLSLPLLLAFLLAVVRLPAARTPLAVAGLAGLAYGCGLLAGASVILTAIAVPAALWMRTNTLRNRGLALAVFALAAAVPVLPWLVHVDAVLGRPVLTTNAPFNLYVGNNPAATGRFVSLRDTPVAAAWHPMRDSLGELRATDALGGLARTYIRSHPVETAILATRKLALFWIPDLPRNDQHGSIVTALRWAEVLEYLAIAALAAVAVAGWRHRSTGERLIIVTIAAFWLVHAAAYVMPRYRQPVLPLMLILAAGTLAPMLGRQRSLRVAHA